MANRRIFVVWLLAVVLANSGLGVDAFRASMKAMACCARMHHACAGIDSPDDCCQRMGHTPASSTTASPAAVPTAAASTAAVMPVASTATLAMITASRRLIAEPAFKRPHDPPHLHPVPLLI